MCAGVNASSSSASAKSAVDRGFANSGSAMTGPTSVLLFRQKCIDFGRFRFHKAAIDAIGKPLVKAIDPMADKVVT